MLKTILVSPINPLLSTSSVGMKKFLETMPRNGWFKIFDAANSNLKIGEVYLRKATRLPPDRSSGVSEYVTIFEIANVEIQEQHRRKGYFKEIFQAMLAECTVESGYFLKLENIVTPEMLEFAKTVTEHKVRTTTDFCGVPTHIYQLK